MRSEEGYDPACTGCPESVDVDPPTPATRYSKREVGQGLDARPAQDRGDARLEPKLDCVADEGRRNGRAAKLLDGVGHGARGRGTLAARPSEELRQVITVA
jgi:hypothetical protein